MGSLLDMYLVDTQNYEHPLSRFMEIANNVKNYSVKTSSDFTNLH